MKRLKTDAKMLWMGGSWVCRLQRPFTLPILQMKKLRLAGKGGQGSRCWTEGYIAGPGKRMHLLTPRLASQSCRKTPIASNPEFLKPD